MKVLPDSAYLPEADMHGRYVWAGIREGLWPFRPRTINLYLERDIDYNRYVLFAEIWFPDFQLRARVDMDASDVAADPTRESIKACEAFKQQLRNREDYALAPLICLGEN